MPGPVLNGSYSINSFNIIIIPLLQVRPLKFSGIMSIAQDHTASIEVL